MGLEGIHPWEPGCPPLPYAVLTAYPGRAVSPRQAGPAEGGRSAPGHAHFPAPPGCHSRSIVTHSALIYQPVTYVISYLVSQDGCGLLAPLALSPWGR